MPDKTRQLIDDIDLFLSAPDETWYLGHIVKLLERSRDLLREYELRDGLKCTTEKETTI